MCCQFRHQRSGIAKGGRMADGKRGQGLSFARFDKFASSKLKMYITSPDSGTLEEKALSRQELVLTNNR